MSLLGALLIGWSVAAATAGWLGIDMPLTGRRARDRSALLRRRARDRTWLQQAGVRVAPLQFVVASVGAGLTVLLVLAVVVGPIVALVPAVAIAGAPRLYYGRRRMRRLAAVQQAWPDGLRDLLASIRAGQPIGAAVDTLARHGPEPLREALVRFPSLRRSLGTVPALEVVREELADPVSDRVLEVLILASERGGAVVPTVLESLTGGITADVKLGEELQTAMLESRINARAVVALPWCVLVLLNVGNGPFRDFYRSPAGLGTVVVGAVLTVVGSVLIARLGRLPVEDRVLGGAS